MSDATRRLNDSLELLGFVEAKLPHQKTNLLHAIQLHAGLIGDRELELACNEKIEKIIAEVNLNHVYKEEL